MTASAYDDIQAVMRTLTLPLWLSVSCNCSAFAIYLAACTRSVNSFTSSSMTPLAGPAPLLAESRRCRPSLPLDESLGVPPLGVPLAELAPCSLLSSTGMSKTPLPCCEVVLLSPNRRGVGMPHLQSTLDLSDHWEREGASSSQDYVHDVYPWGRSGVPCYVERHFSAAQRGLEAHASRMKVACSNRVHALLYWNAVQGESLLKPKIGHREGKSPPAAMQAFLVCSGEHDQESWSAVQCSNCPGNLTFLLGRKCLGAFINAKGCTSHALLQPMHTSG